LNYSQLSSGKLPNHTHFPSSFFEQDAEIVVVHVRVVAEKNIFLPFFSYAGFLAISKRRLIFAK
jgi:hypothetical protein